MAGGKRRSATAVPVAFRGHIVGQDLDISCRHLHASLDNAQACARLAMKVLRYRESLSVSVPMPVGWYKTAEMPQLSGVGDIEPDELLAQMEGRESS